MNPASARAKLRRIMRESDEKRPLRRLADRINPVFVVGVLIGAIAIGAVLSKAAAAPMGECRQIGRVTA